MHSECLQTSLVCDEFDSENGASILGWAGKPADELAAEVYSGDLLLTGGPAVYTTCNFVVISDSLAFLTPPPALYR